jgi:uncharacterized membrane protein
MSPLLAHAGGGYGDNPYFTPWEIHPALVHFPIAFLIGAVLLDLFAVRRPESGWARTATGLMVAGVVTGLITGLAGLLAFFTLPGTHTEAAHATMYWHLGVQAAALVLFAVACWARWGVVPGLGVRLLGWAAAVLLVVGSALGGWIVYHGGAGIDARLVAPGLHEGDHEGGGHEEGHEHPSSTEPGHEGHHH